MREPQPKTIHLKDYTPPAFRVETVDLDIDIKDDHAIVRAKLAIKRLAPGQLVLDGDEVELISAAVDGNKPRYEATPDKLTVYDVPEHFTLETVSRIVPQKNTKLEGLYATKNGFVTQCEAEGFRRITWFIDRPDVMATYTTTIHADQKRYPVLLSNGNLAGSGEEAAGRHWARFHDSTGDSVTCRDWFQRSLKEGLTVFRDQEYGADLYSRAMTRIQEVRNLRAAQFPEDAGTMKHPVRPQSYMEIRNFYTMTVYEKGAEVVRMQHTLLGEEKFQAGMRLYFQRHDGQAVTCDDFVRAMENASGIDLGQFKRWYDVAGTPAGVCGGHYQPGI